MSKFSVKKPLTVFVAVIAILVLGVVAYLKMTPDLFPNMNFPYIMVMTTYPGASPEKVEAEITKPLEQSMSTLENIKSVTSTSAENYSMLLLEFEEDTSLDTVGVDIQQNISALSAGWDDMVGAPYILKINPSMIPVEVAAVSMEGMDVIELTEFMDETLMNKLEGIAGVARITASGAVSQELHVVLDQNLIDALNKTLAAAINQKMDDALTELNDQKQQLTDAQAQLESAKEQLESGKQELSNQTAAGEAELSYQQAQLLSTKAQLQDQLTQLQSGKLQMEAIVSVLKSLQSGIGELEKQAAGIRADLDILLGLQADMTELARILEDFQKQIEDIQNNPALDQEQIDAAVSQIQNSDAYKQAQAAWAQLEAELKASGLDPDSLQQSIEEKQAALEDISQRLQAMEEILAAEGFDRETLDQTLAEMEGSITQMDAGIKQLEDALAQIDSGMLQLRDAQKLLSEQKTAGLLEISSAVSEITANSANLSNAMMQLEGGLDMLETSRKDALAQANLNDSLTMDMISSILTAQNFAMPAGTLTQDGISYMVSVGEEITQLADLQNLLLFDMGMEGVEPIYLKDVAMVMVTDNSAETYARLNGQDGIVLSFEKQSNYATAEATKNIAARFEELEQDYPGLEFEALMDQGDYIYLIVDNIINSLLMGALFAILILFLFLKDLRPTLITLCSIPISVVFAIVLMYFSGVTLNMISLSGLAVAVGMLVDNAVVVIENIYRLRAKGANAIQAAVSGAAQVAGAVTSSTLTTVCVFAPIVFVEGITRQLFTDLALTMTYALLASLIVSLTLVPAMAAGMLRKEKQTKSRIMDKLLSAYGKAITWSLGHKAIVLLTALALLVASAGLSMARGFAFMPEMDSANVTVTVTMPEDADMEKAAALADEVLERIGTVDGIVTVGAMMSSAGLGGLGGMGGMGAAGGGAYDVTVYVILEDENGSGAAIGKQIDALCADMECEVKSSSAMMDMSMLTGSGISLRIYAEDMDDLQSAAKQAAQILRDLPGTTEISDGLEETTPALHVDIDRNKAMAKGMTVAQIYMELAAALKNTTAMASMELGGTTTAVIIEKPEDARLTMEALKNYTFSVTGRDGTVSEFALSEVAELKETTSLNSISRLDQRRNITVTAQLAEGENVTLLTTRAQQVMEEAQFPEGVTYEFTGENEMIMEAVEQMLLMLALGILLVYLVMVAQFQSLKSPFIVMFTIPLAFTGGFLALLICGMEVSVISLIGFVMLTGVIVNNGIVLVDYINQLRHEGAERRAAIVEAGKTRMRPILMTSLTTVLGLTEMALGLSAGTVMMQPIAVVCIGGLLYATLMTLFVVPCIYDMMNRKALRTVSEADLEILDI